MLLLGANGLADVFLILLLSVSHHGAVPYVLAFAITAYKI